MEFHDRSGKDNSLESAIEKLQQRPRENRFGALARGALAVTDGMTQSLVSIIGDQPLSAFLADWQPREISPSEEWLDMPPQEFLDFARAAEENPMWSIPPRESYLKQPNFLISQVHRLWVSAKLASQYCGESGSLLDLGSFPFVVPIALRKFFGHRGDILGSVIQPMAEEDMAYLNALEIRTAPLDLDPYVVDSARGDQLPNRLAAPDESFDVCTLYHVIEHLYHPMNTLAEVHRLLRPSGKLLISTDNAYMINTFQNVISDYGYIFEPVETTAAMQVHDWRGHVRFFTERDLKVMVEAAGFRVVDVQYREIFYDVMFADYFENPGVYLSGWKIDLLEKHPRFRNDIILVAEKV